MCVCEDTYTSDTPDTSDTHRRHPGPLERNPTRTKEKFALMGPLFSF